MSQGTLSPFHLPFIYGAKAKATTLREEQANRLDSFWMCQASRCIEDPGDERVENQVKVKWNARESIYLAENRRLESLLNRKKRPHVIKKKKVRPRIVDDMIRLEYQYQKAAKVVQRVWRRYSRRTFWQRYVIATRAATQIQRLFRGILCRKLVGVWHLSRLRFATKIQAMYRGHLYRRVLETRLQWEVYNATMIQRWTRGHFGRQRAVKVRQHMAALHIQCLFRGYQSRQDSDKLWLGSKATRIQKHMRRFLVQKYVRAMTTRYHKAAIAIQRIFRGTLARTKVDDILRERETHNRKVVMDVLDAEISWYISHVDKLERRLEKSRLHEIVVELETELYRRHIQVNDMESIYLDMVEQKVKMSPRAITDGWLSEMEGKIAAQRQKITLAKLDAVFGHGYEFKRSEALLNERRRVLDKAIFRKNQLIRWRNEEFLDYWSREMKHQALLREEAHRRNVADQRRKWAIKLYTKSGKVLLHPKKRNDDDNFTMANTNLLAFTKPPPNPVDAIADQVKLVTVNSQLAQASAMFSPLLDRFSTTHSTIQQMTRDAHPPPKPPQETVETEAKDTMIEAKEPSTSSMKAISPAREKLQAKHPQKIAKPVPKSAHVPWALLDQLHAEKEKLKTQIAVDRFRKKK
ncbi:hypothetical protein LEN26_016983 [Aphanomyces euteiches]|nr:hypothetical protein LEN26_016983 [Aphanomyces euteiches]